MEARRPNKTTIMKKTRNRPAYVKATKPSSAPRPKKVKLTQAEVWASFGLNKPHTPRYNGLKGILWYVTSKYVRMRDFKAYNRCISCNKWMENWESLQAGHYIAAGTGGNALLFDLRNINGECGYCNGFDQNHLVGYEIGLNERYGAGFAQNLKNEYVEARKVGAPTVKALDDKGYRAKINELLAGIELL